MGHYIRKEKLENFSLSSSVNRRIVQEVKQLSFKTLEHFRTLQWIKQCDAASSSTPDFDYETKKEIIFYQFLVEVIFKFR